MKGWRKHINTVINRTVCFHIYLPLVFHFTIIFVLLVFTGSPLFHLPLLPVSTIQAALAWSYMSALYHLQNANLWFGVHLHSLHLSHKFFRIFSELYVMVIFKVGFIGFQSQIFVSVQKKLWHIDMWASPPQALSISLTQVRKLHLCSLKELQSNEHCSIPMSGNSVLFQ